MKGLMFAALCAMGVAAYAAKLECVWAVGQRHDMIRNVLKDLKK